MNSSEDETSDSLLSEKIKRALMEGAVAALVTLVEGKANVGAKILCEETGALSGSFGDEKLDEAVTNRAQKFLLARVDAATYKVEEFAPQLDVWSGARVLFERLEPEPRIVVCGAGHVGASLARLAHAVGYRVTLIDDRGDFVRHELFPEDIELIAATNWSEALRANLGTGRGVAVAVVTRGHNEDEECMKAVLAVNPDYVGMIGSKRRTNIVLERLREEGFDENVLREVRAPVGLDIGAVTPEEVALAILAEIVALRRNGSGAPLSAWRRA
ncbi:MAG: XdhC family protein [Pyrinomonadaceae bacterium]|nr:XdhC family protein [Pyrinomonadaceae bacterium]